MSIEEKYKKYTDIQHILERPGMYIGSIDLINASLPILTSPDKIEIKTIEYIPGLYKIFDEIIVNAFDQTIRDPTVSTIKVNITDTQIQVYNDGVGIDVVIHKEEKIYVPELIFSHLRTSTSYSDDNRITGGTHGYGAKLTAILSTSFKVHIGDTKHKKEFTQIYKNNIKTRSSPIIKPYNKSNGFVMITFVPDFAYFKINKLSNDMIKLFNRRVYDIASIVKNNVKVYLNNKLIIYKTFPKYVSLYTENQQVNISCKYWNIVITKSNKYHQISFVNSVFTVNGGKHVDYILNQIIKGLKNIILSKFKNSSIKSQFLKDHLNLFISSTIVNPEFSSQTKDELTTSPHKFGSVCELNKNDFQKIYKILNLDDIVSKYIKYLDNQSLTKMGPTSKKSVLKGVEKLNDANFAGTKNSHMCTLILTEGDSAKSMAISGLSAIPKSNNIYGVFPLKGKLLNVKEASNKQILENIEFKNLQTIIGLKIGEKYDESNIKSLRYGSVILMMDADVDGSHIKGLFINMINHFWPSLLKIKGFIKMFITPVIKIKKGTKTLSFYSREEFSKYKGDYTYIKYYKGLGTSTADEAKEYFINLDKHLIEFKWDENTFNSINLAFSKDQADKRKEWLKKYDKNNTLNYDNKIITYNDFINKELIHFANSDNIRSIPNVIDGLKPGQRKILYSAFKKKLNIEIKVAQFSGYVAEHTAYHHGEVSLMNTIINMAQNYVGSNNINLFDPIGQFGTRLLGGKDHASPRYIFTRLNAMTRYIFPLDDDDLLTYLNEENMSIEPMYYLPIIPMILINGADGIGTGYSTNIPKYNPLDVIENIILKLNGKKYKKLVPWYNNFTGEIKNNGSKSWSIKGNYKIDNNKINVTELPIGLWTENYKTYLEKLLETGLVKKILNNCTDVHVNFTITVNCKNINENDADKLLNITKYTNTNNMHAYDSNNILKKYSDPLEILEEFYNLRLKYYEKRKNMLLTKIKSRLDILKSQSKFIDMIIKNKIKILGQDKEKILQTIKNNNFHHIKDDPEYKYLVDIPVYSFSKNKIDKLTNTIKLLEIEYNKLLKMTAKNMWLDDLEHLKSMILKNNK